MNERMVKGIQCEFIYIRITSNLITAINVRLKVQMTAVVMRMAMLLLMMMMMSLGGGGCR